MVLDSKLTVKIIDFGSSCCISEESGLLTERLGSSSYLAPEILTGKGYDGEQTDVFSLGVALFLMVVGIHPFHIALAGDERFKALNSSNKQAFW